MEVTLASLAKLDGQRIGLLGGSFNPAHAGHLQMSLFALSRLKLDAVWWLVSPLHPIKKTNEMQAFQKRLAFAREVAKGCARLVVTDIEARLKTRYTIDTLRALKSRAPKANFVWLMGEDNLVSLPLWRSWEALMRELPIAVFKRSGYSDSCERCEAAASFANAELPLAAVEHLAVITPPAWVVLDNPLNPLSATQIRGGRNLPEKGVLTMVVAKKKPAVKKAVKKPAAKKPAAKKPAAKKPAVKKAVKKVVKKAVKKPAAKKPAVKKAVKKVVKKVVKKAVKK